MDDVAGRLERHIPALRRYAWALVRQREGADDLVQDCLERAVARWALRRRDGDLRAWLFAILHNLFVDALRRRRRQGLHVDLDHISDLAASGVDPEGGIGLRDAAAHATLRRSPP